MRKTKPPCGQGGGGAAAGALARSAVVPVVTGKAVPVATDKFRVLTKRKAIEAVHAAEDARVFMFKRQLFSLLACVCVCVCVYVRVCLCVCVCVCVCVWRARPE